MKKVLIVLGVVVVVLVLAVGGFALFLNNGKAATETLAIGPINPAQLADGTYNGQYSGGRFTNRLEVTVQDGKITAIDVMQPVVIEKEEVRSRIIQSVIDSQSTDVDTQTGATITTKAYLKSIEDALDGK